MSRGHTRSMSALLSAAGFLSLSFALSFAQDPANDARGAEAFVGNKATRTYHRATCPAAMRTAAKAKVELADTASAKESGYKPCPQCKPDQPGADEGQAGGKSTAKAGAGLLYSRDIAPIFAGNCNGCHDTKNKRGDFIISSFDSMMKGSKSGPVIVPGKPEESLLVQLVEERKMPRGGNRRLSDEAIAKIRDWVKQGATLDAGTSPTATVDQVAPSPEEMRKERLAALPANEVDAELERIGRERWKQATSKSEPTVTAGRKTLVFSNLPEARAKALARAVDGTRATLESFFPEDPGEVLGGPEKLSIYVFNDKGAYTEFRRAVEKREVELGIDAHAKLDLEAPYVVAIDPLAGAAEPAASKSKSSRKKSEGGGRNVDRSLASLAVGAFAAGVVEASGQPPKWLSEGFGAYVAVMAEPRGGFASKLRAEAAEQLRIGGATRLTEALGDQTSPDALRALGFSLCEWMAAEAQPAFGEFVRGMTQEGTAKLDTVITAVFGPESNRDDLLEGWGGFIASHYGMRRR